MYRTVLVPLDGTRFADGAVRTARALDTDPGDPRVHVEVDTDVAAAVRRCASKLDACPICLSTHGRGGVAATLIGSAAPDIIERAGPGCPRRAGRAMTSVDAGRFRLPVVSP